MEDAVVMVKLSFRVFALVDLHKRACYSPGPLPTSPADPILWTQPNNAAKLLNVNITRGSHAVKLIRVSLSTLRPVQTHSIDVMTSNFIAKRKRFTVGVDVIETSGM